MSSCWIWRPISFLLSARLACLWEPFFLWTQRHLSPEVLLVCTVDTSYIREYPGHGYSHFVPENIFRNWYLYNVPRLIFFNSDILRILSKNIFLHWNLQYFTKVAEIISINVDTVRTYFEIAIYILYHIYKPSKIGIYRFPCDLDSRVETCLCGSFSCEGFMRTLSFESVATKT